jgi:hypothetical protein
MPAPDGPKHRLQRSSAGKIPVLDARAVLSASRGNEARSRPGSRFCAGSVTETLAAAPANRAA